MPIVADCFASAFFVTSTVAVLPMRLVAHVEQSARCLCYPLPACSISAVMVSSVADVLAVLVVSAVSVWSRFYCCRWWCLPPSVTTVLAVADCCVWLIALQQRSAADVFSVASVELEVVLADVSAVAAYWLWRCCPLRMC